jgi:hypothetical protein
MANLTPFPPKLHEEPNHWYRRFCIWLAMRPKRSVLDVHNQERARKGLKRIDGLPGSWDGKPELYDWVERAKKWDIAETERLNAELAQAREEWQTTELAAAKELLGKGRAFIEAIPLASDFLGDKPVKGDPQAVRVATQCIMDASTLARRALAMPTERHVNQFERMSDVELLRFIETELKAA